MGAFPVAAARELTIRVLLRGLAPRQRSLQIRARSAGALRVPETRLMVGPGAVMDLELPVVGLPSDQVRTLRETWVWECRTAPRGDFLPCGGQNVEICIYVTAGEPLSALPLESYYHVACAAPAKTAAEAEQAVWSKCAATASAPTSPMPPANPSPSGSPTTPSDSAPWSTPPAAPRTSSAPGTASCKGWSDLFREALAIHGIRASFGSSRPIPMPPVCASPSCSHRTAKAARSPSAASGCWSKASSGAIPRSTPPRPTHPATSSPPEASPGNSTCAATNAAPSGAARNVARMVGMGHLGRREGMFSEHAVVAVQRDGRDIIYDPTFGLGPHESLPAYQRNLMGDGEEDVGGLCAIVGYRPALAPDPATGRPRPSASRLCSSALPESGSQLPQETQRGLSPA